MLLAERPLRSPFLFALLKFVYFYILKHNQQDATLYNIRLLLSVFYMFRAVFPLIIRSSKTVHAASGTCQTCMLWPLAWVSRSDSKVANFVCDSKLI